VFRAEESPFGTANHVVGVNAPIGPTSRSGTDQNWMIEEQLRSVIGFQKPFHIGGPAARIAEGPKR
jgi:hypothetical protein